MRQALEAIRIFVLRHRLAVSLSAAFILYFLCTVFYMGDAALNCSESLLVFPGDNTAGLIALFSIDSYDPWWGRSDIWSFPYGELLGQPTHITAQALFIPFWGLAKFMGPVCGFNILTMFGFVSAALTMFAFIRWLTGGRIMVAFIAGFAVAFTPYLQIKTGVHLSYVFEALFIGSIWLFFAFWRNPTWKKALLLGLFLALFAYTDGYFILLGGILIMTVIGSSIISEYIKSKYVLTKELISRLKLLAISAAAALVLIAPVLYVQFSAASQINDLLASSRDSIDREAQVYGARPLEYIIPNAFNPVLSPIFGTYAERDNHGSNSAENVLSLSLVLLAFAVYFVVHTVIARKRRTRLVTGAVFDTTFIAIVFGVTAIVAFLFSLPPKLGPITTPSFFLIEFVQVWRVLARLSVIVNIAMVVLASFGLALFLQKIKDGRWRIAISLAVLVIIFVEYLTFIPPRKVSGYDKVPQLYSWLHDQQQYKEIAEYPLYEFPTSHFPVFYNSYQRVHGKKMLNGAVSEKDPLFARLALRDLQNPQAVPGLRALGIDFIIIHDPVFPGDIPGLRFVRESNEPLIETDGKQGKVWGYAVEPGKTVSYVAAPMLGFHAPLKKSPIHEVQVIGHQGVVRVKKLKKSDPVRDRVDVVLELQSLDKDGQQVRVTQAGADVWNGKVPHAQKMVIRLGIDPQKELVISAVEPKNDPTLLMTGLAVE